MDAEKDSAPPLTRTPRLPLSDQFKVRSEDFILLVVV